MAGIAGDRRSTWCYKLHLRRLVRPPHLDPLGLGPNEAELRVRVQALRHGRQDVGHRVRVLGAVVVTRVEVAVDRHEPPDVAMRVGDHPYVEDALGPLAGHRGGRMPHAASWTPSRVDVCATARSARILVLD
eukprot:SAG11_NODE_9000_length_955_cov_0.903037_1_plen_132_part_00